ncbi:signal-transducing adaptor protein 1-like isoform X1 [Syngnathus typhle]|uniref:signal-transducing adaptor protein 1-like isoform X1 n=1 Tax=Syngnathus typhle TaxID=161592 RepID=UPI002A6A5140|nr:signal-transducing adaptor protein 1-like isoform X1 [Syngnathus typhle]
MNKRQGRPFIVMPHLYHEGFLEKRSFKDKKSQKLWTRLCGNTLYFFNDKRDNDYIEKVELSGPITITDDNTMDYKLDAAKLNLQTKDSDVNFSAPNAEARELWKGYIQSVSQLSVPSKLNLLPGQMVRLEEVVKKEKERVRNAQQCSPTKDMESAKEMPDCFHPVSRVEAEVLLERQANRGNMLLRPNRDCTGFAISTREEMNEPIFKHFRVIRKQDDGFTIDVHEPVSCASLHEIVEYFSEATSGALIPLIREETYEQNFSYISVDHENGEKSVRGPSIHTHSTLPSQQAKQALSRLPSEDWDDNLYVNDKNHKDSTVEKLPEPDNKATEKSVKTPTPTPRKSAPPPAATRPRHSRMRNLTEPHGPSTSILLAAISELKLKFEKRAKCVD